MLRVITPRNLCLAAAAFGLVVSLVATRPASSPEVSGLQRALFWPSVPGFLLAELVLPRKYTIFYCYGEPPPHRDEVVRSGAVALNTLFWPSLVGLIWASTHRLF